MSAVSTQFTLADLERMPDDGVHREILHGELIEMPPPKLAHERLIARINASLVLYLGRKGLGTVFLSKMGYRLLRDDRTWIEPDLSFLRAERVEASAGMDYVDGAPDLAIEVISPSESAQEVDAKIEAYLQGGAHAVAVIYPKTSTVRLFLEDGSGQTLHVGGTLTLPGLLPGWELPVAEIFAAS